MEPTQPEFYVPVKDCTMHHWYDMGVGGRCYKCGTNKSDLNQPVVETPVAKAAAANDSVVVEPPEELAEKRKPGRPKKT